MTALPNDMEQYKNYYENQLLAVMMQPGNTEEAQTAVIEEYTNLRFKTCMADLDFADKVRNSEDGHLYMKVLREQVVDELGLTAEPELNDMLFKTMYEKSANHIKYDLDSMYNMQSVSNTESLGYDSLVQESPSADSHSETFDKLLGDYYLSQRSEYAESNKLMG